MKIILPRDFTLTHEPIVIQMGNKIVKFPNKQEYKTITVYVLGEKFGKRETESSKIIYDIDSSFAQELFTTINKMYRGPGYSEIVSTLFKYNLLCLVVVGETGQRTFHIFETTDLIKPERGRLTPWVNHDGTSYYICSINLCPPLLGWSIASDFWVSSQIFRACQSNLPLSTLLRSDEYLSFKKSHKIAYFYNAFRFYLWHKPFFVDTVPDFSVVDSLRVDYLGIERPLLKELMKATLKFSRLNLSVANILIFPELFI